MIFVLVIVLLFFVSVQGFAPKANIVPSSSLGFFGKKAAPEPEPEPIKPTKKGIFNFGKKDESK